MKTVKLLILLSLVAFAGQAKPKKPGAGVLVISRNHDLFYFRVNKKQLGGDVKVFNDHNALVAEKQLDSKQNIIDFFEAPPGKYTIRIHSSFGDRNFYYSKGKKISKISVATNAGEHVLSSSTK